MSDLNDPMDQSGKPPVTIADLKEAVGKEIGVSQWHEISQEMINAFADVTKDHNFIHVDPVRAAETPFGGTIAHGFLTLSMLSVFAYQAMARLEGVTAYLQTRLEEVSAERDELATAQRRVQTELADARAELARLTERANQEQNRRFALESEVDDLRSDLASTESEVDRLRSEASRLEVANAELVTQRNELAAQRARKYKGVPLPGSGT